MNSILKLITCLFAFNCNVALAQGLHTESATKLIELIVMPNRPDRTALARVTSNYCEEMLKVIPSNSPSEAAWIDKELNTTNIPKIRRVLASAEYARHFLVEMFVGCKSLSPKLIKYGNTASRIAAIYWTQLALIFQNTEDAKIHAARIGIYDDGKDIYGFNKLNALRRAANFSVLTTLETLP